jgi:glucose-1-phosphate thymidylyltransferase
MKGVILAGGLGTRLRPLTDVTNKHLLPVYDRPMVYYPIQCMQAAGIDEIMVVTGGPHGGMFFNLLRNGEAFGLKRMAYGHQEGAGGIAQALSLAEEFVDGDDVCVILGDNIVGGTIRGAADRFRRQQSGARVLLREVPDPHRFGVVRFDDETRSRIVEVQEKPKNPPSNLAVIGIYFYDNQVFDICRTLKPSARGELEITDVNNAYIARGEMEHDLLEGWWIDAGTVESLHQASALVAMHGANRPEALDIEVQIRAASRPMRRATDRVEEHAGAPSR